MTITIVFAGVAAILLCAALIVVIAVQGANAKPTEYRTLTGPVTITRIDAGEVWFESPGEYGIFAIDDIHPDHRDDLIVGHCFSEFQVVEKSYEPSR